MTSLYQLTTEYRDAATKLAEMEGIDEQTFTDTLESLSGELEHKAVSVAMVMRNFESLAAQIKDAEAQMYARRKLVEAKVERLKHYLLTNMQACGIKRIESPQFCITVRSNQPHVDPFDPQQVPQEFWRVPPPPPAVLDKVAIATSFKSGKDVPGCRMVSGMRVEVK